MIRVNGGIGGMEKSQESVDQEKQQKETGGLGDAAMQRIQHADETIDSLRHIPVTGEKESQGTLARINAHVASVRSSQKTPEVTKNIENTTREKSFDEMLCKEHFRQLVDRGNVLGLGRGTEQFNTLFRKYNERDENDQELPLTEKQSIVKEMEVILLAQEQRLGRVSSYPPGEVGKAMDTIKSAWYKEKPDLYRKFYNDWITAKTQKEKDTVTLRYAALAERDLATPEPTKEELRELYQRTQRGLEYYLHSRAQLPQVVIPNTFIGKQSQASFGTNDMRPQQEMALNLLRGEAYGEVERGLEEVGGQALVKLFQHGYHTFGEKDEQENFLRSIYKSIETLRELQKKIEKK